MVLWRYGWLRGCLRGGWPPKGVYHGLGLCGLDACAVERYRPPSVIARTLAYDGLRMLDDFAREYRGHVGEVMDYVFMELRSLLYEVLGGE
jgi:hypothetical protein